MPKVREISFNGRLARERGQQVRYITDRAVFALEDDGLVLIEVAPGSTWSATSSAGWASGRGSPTAARDGPAAVRDRPMGLAADFEGRPVTGLVMLELGRSRTWS